MCKLDVLKLPLCGSKLIEASAGTGKTYMLIILYIRLLLCLGNKSDFYRPLTVEEILVVTFTKSTAQDLRLRIRKSICQFKLDCIRGYSNEELFSKLLLQINNIDLAIYQLNEAIKKINQASIFTIHGFCQKILNYNTIELNILFNTTIIDNEIALYQQICSDFWRRYFYPLPLNIVSFIQEHWKNPNDLLSDIIPYIRRYQSGPNCFNSCKNNKNIVVYYEKIINYIKNIKKTWNEQKCNMIAIINSCNINRIIYNKRNLAHWIDAIHQWATQPTIDHSVPKNLKRFRKRELKIHDNHIATNHTYDIFTKIEELYQKLSLFKTLILNIAINEIRDEFNSTRYTRSEITFNDIIDILAHNLVKDKGNNKLAHIIRTQYPIAIIDEFQDTDQKQYEIFHKIYFNYLKNGLILIGDPKQSIYTFRGADIFAYIKIRKIIYNKYTLNINWRSSPGIINAINTFFQFTSNPFVFKEIPFVPSVTSNQNNEHKFIINNKLQTAMCFWLHPAEIVTINDYKQAMAQECAIVLHNLLYEIHNGTAWLETKKHKRKLKMSDITILVRNHEEASLVNSALYKMNISTIFLSNKKSIFETIEAYELSLLLQAILFPEHRTISTALTTIFFKLNAADIENINNNESQWEQILEEFLEYYSIWKKQGILLMIYRIIFHYKIPEKLLSTQYEENNLINILHLGELLQNASQELPDEYALTDWLTLKITQPQDNKTCEQSLRLNKNQQLIQISTIHKAKGLEFPLIFLPFMADFKHKKNLFFHKKQSYTTDLNISESKLNSELANEERLSEDLRLLYVAITRSIYHCSLGIGPIVRRYKKKTNITNNDLHHCALGYLIQKKTPGNAETLRKYLKTLNINSNGDISFRIISKNPEKLCNTPLIVSPHQSLSAKKWNTRYTNYAEWNMTSFSALTKTDSTTIYLDLQKQSEINENVKFQKNNIVLNQHTFPKGKIYGNFFHDIFKVLNFTKFVDMKWLCMHMEKYNIDHFWKNVIQKWIYTIINTPLNNDNLTLAQITSKDKKTELKFYLPINTNLTSQKLDYLCKYYDSLSYQSSSLTFTQIQGMLQGFIDLVFRWNNKYYLLDYKTNWLGKNDDAYIYSKIEQEIIKHNYTLQYQLYTLALHRFLRNKLISYNYEKDFGGIYYLFIRGMNGTPFSNGIFFFRPLKSFINKLDNLFSGI